MGVRPGGREAAVSVHEPLPVNRRPHRGERVLVRRPDRQLDDGEAPGLGGEPAIRCQSAVGPRDAHREQRGTPALGEDDQRSDREPDPPRQAVEEGVGTQTGKRGEGEDHDGRCPHRHAERVEPRYDVREECIGSR